MSTDMSFSVTPSIDVGFAAIRFSHTGESVPAVQLRLGILDDGVARAGDGMDYVQVSSDIDVVLFDPGSVDGSSISADYAGGIAADSEFALFLTWSTAQNAQVHAVGLTGKYSARSGFQFGEPVHGADAIDYMIAAEMITDEDRRPALPDPAPEGRAFDYLAVAGYRGFSEARKLQFATPTGSPGSGLTLVVGANNSGKSTFVEAIQIAARARTFSEISFPQPRRNALSDAVNIRLVRSDGRSLEVRSVRDGGSQAAAHWLPEGAAPAKFDIHVTPSRRSFNPFFGSSGIADRDWGLMDQEFSRTQTRDQFVGRLRKVDRDPTAREVFDGLLTRIVGQELEWTIDEIAPSQQFVKLIEKDAWHTSEGLGDGLVSLLFIVDALYDSEPGSLIAIDEPELSLHPQLIRRLRGVLSEFASDRQIVVATHSPLMIDWADIANGATVARIFKKDGASQIGQASAATLAAVAKFAGERNVFNPHIVDSIAREAFFLDDGIILLEGQDDVTFFPRVLDDLELTQKGTVYGWGSGGASNIPTLAQMFIELGFERIAAVLDDDGQAETASAETKLAAMAPQVAVRRIPAPDIRFKKAVTPREAVLGLLQEDGHHVRTELRAQAAEALREVLDHVGG